MKTKARYPLPSYPVRWGGERLAFGGEVSNYPWSEIVCGIDLLLQFLQWWRSYPQGNGVTGNDSTNPNNRWGSERFRGRVTGITLPWEPCRVSHGSCLVLCGFLPLAFSVGVEPFFLRTNATGVVHILLVRDYPVVHGKIDDVVAVDANMFLRHWASPAATLDCSTARGIRQYATPRPLKAPQARRQSQPSVNSHKALPYSSARPKTGEGWPPGRTRPSHARDIYSCPPSRPTPRGNHSCPN